MQINYLCKASSKNDFSKDVESTVVKQKAKWAAIENGDHTASVTTHIEKTESNAGTTKLQRERITPGPPP